MSAFDDIAAAEFDDTTSNDFIWIDESPSTEALFDVNGILDINTVQKLHARIAQRSKIPNARSGSAEFNALDSDQPVERALSMLSSWENRERILQLRESHACALMDTIQTVRSYRIV
jgi:hypothetical protein